MDSPARWGRLVAAELELSRQVIVERPGLALSVGGVRVGPAGVGCTLRAMARPGSSAELTVEYVGTPFPHPSYDIRAWAETGGVTIPAELAPDGGGGGRGGEFTDGAGIRGLGIALWFPLAVDELVDAVAIVVRWHALGEPDVRVDLEPSALKAAARQAQDWA